MPYGLNISMAQFNVFALLPFLLLVFYVSMVGGFDTSKHSLASFTGPSSGGKTAFCKTLTQIQLLLQVGCYVPVQSAAPTIADRIFYQTPGINSLDQDADLVARSVGFSKDDIERILQEKLSTVRTV